MINKFLNKIFDTKNEKEVKKYKNISDKILKLESYYEKLSNDEIKHNFNILKEKVLQNEETLETIKIDVFAMVREISKRLLNMQHFEVQLIGGLVLHDGKIAEMKTGEGKTLVATLPAILNAINKQVHIVTVNDYLASRDAKEFEPLYNFFGFSVGINISHLKNQEKEDIYNSNIIYGTNNEFGFDYLRDNLKYNSNEFLQKKHEFVIIDEIDSILIDEAKSPLIISGPSTLNKELYYKCQDFIKELKIEEDFLVKLDDRRIEMNEIIIPKIETYFEIENLYDLNNAYISHYVEQTLIANYLYEKDIHYVVNDNEIIIVDTFTGRLSKGKRYSNGLHQALEAKEDVEIQPESKTLIDITFQNYFRLYDKLSGMTGTAQNEATEFSIIYNLDVVTIPPNKTIQRIDNLDLIFMNETAKYNAILKKIIELNKKQQPILIGTTSIEKSEMLSNFLHSKNIEHKVLNAKRHEEEAHIIEKAGELNAITIATNMAGRGVDIKISREVNELGGLYIIGTERHENRRIDDQLRGRSGRQGDNGKTQFYLSLDDDLIKIFGGHKLKKIMNKIGVTSEDTINSKMISNAIEKAQKKIENMHFEQRKHILEYDDIINEQRKIILKFRKNILLDQINLEDKNNEMIHFYVSHLMANNIKSEFNIEQEEIKKINDFLQKNIGIEINIDIIKEEKKDYQFLKTFIISTLNQFKNEKQKNINRDELFNYYKQLLLQVIDEYWRIHMELLDNIRIGTKLRAYNNKDPLSEFKKDSYNHFEQLLINIKIKYINLIYRFELHKISIEEKSNISLSEAEKFLELLKSKKRQI